MTNSQDSTVTVPLTQAEQVRGRILELQEALQQNMPGYEGLLHTIHRNLAQDPDTVHLLSEEEIGIICLGLSKRTGVFIAQEKEGKSGSGSGGKKGKATLDDLI
jgi:hypothetical protein